MDNIKALSWKKRYAFLHVVEDILGVFDELHIKPFLDLLVGCVVRILASSSSSLVCTKSSSTALVENRSTHLHVSVKDGGAEHQTTVRFRLCWKVLVHNYIIYSIDLFLHH